MDSEGRKIIVCDNGTGVRLYGFAPITCFYSYLLFTWISLLTLVFTKITICDATEEVCILYISFSFVLFSVFSL